MNCDRCDWKGKVSARASATFQTASRTDALKTADAIADHAVLLFTQIAPCPSCGYSPPARKKHLRSAISRLTIGALLLVGSIALWHTASTRHDAIMAEITRSPARGEAKEVLADLAKREALHRESDELQPLFLAGRFGLIFGPIGVLLAISGALRFREWSSAKDQVTYEKAPVAREWAEVLQRR